MSIEYFSVKDIKEGMMIDLEGDFFADPHGDNKILSCEYQEVSVVERETEDCVAIEFEGFDVVGFPTDHKLKVKS